MGGLEGEADTTWRRSQLLRRYPARRQVMPQRCLDIALPKVLAEAKPDREVEHQINVGPRLAARRHDSLTQLHPLIGGLVDPETDAQPFAFPCAGDWQNDVGIAGSRRQVEIGLHVEFEIAQRLRACAGVGMRQQQVDAEPDETAHAIWLALQDRAIGIIRGHEPITRQAERALLQSQRLFHWPGGRSSVPATLFSGTCARCTLPPGTSMLPVSACRME